MKEECNIHSDNSHEWALIGSDGTAIVFFCVHCLKRHVMTMMEFNGVVEPHTDKTDV